MGDVVHADEPAKNRTATIEEALTGFDPTPIAARIVRATIDIRLEEDRIFFIANCRTLAIVARVVGRLYQLGHEPGDVDNDEAELAIGAIVEAVREERFEGSPNVAGLYHIDSIVGWGTLNKSRTDLLRALRWQMVARAADCLFGVRA
jgi:hypothetical protein